MQEVDEMPKKPLCLLLGILMLLAVARAVQAQDVPNAITYQGKLTDTAGLPVPDGLYQVQFKLYDVPTDGTAFWTSTTVSVQCKEGLFTSQMTPISSTVIAGKTTLWLETWVGSPGTALSPRAKLVSVPFALRAGDLTLPFSGTASSAGPALLVTNSSGTAISAAGAGSGTAVRGYATGTGKAGHFEIANNSSSADALTVTTNGSGDAFQATTTGEGAAVEGYSTGAGNAVFGHNNGTGRAGFFYIPAAANPSTALEAKTEGIGCAAEFETTNTADPSPAISVTSNSAGAGIEVHKVSSQGSAATFYLDHAGNVNYFALRVETEGDKPAVYAKHNQSGCYSYLGASYCGVYGLAGSAENTYGVYGSSLGDTGRGVYGKNYGINGAGVYGEASGSSGVGVYGTASGTDGHAVEAVAPGTDGYAVYADANGANGTGIYARGGAGGHAAIFSGNILIRHRDTGHSVMELGTGLDYAEGFDVSDESSIKPGTVLVIDSRHPGKLTVSAQPYDRRVAGIVAGAGGIESGVRLGADSFDHDVALAGRVYCNVDASKTAVEPGDLLTTSSTPGHAMKVTNYSRAQGAILGKAMEPLPKGRKGQILVLVSLQ